MRDIILLIDIENQSTFKLDEGILELKASFQSEKINITRIGIASKNKELLSRWKELCNSTFSIPKSQIFALNTQNKTNSSDMALSFLAGMFLMDNNLNTKDFIILTEDKVLSSTMRFVELYGGLCEVRAIDKSKFTRPLTKLEINFEADKYPFLEYIDRGLFPRLVCKRTPKNCSPSLGKIIINDYGEEIIIGRAGSDINLDYWDDLKTKSIYNKHVFIGFQSNRLYIRSAKGFRRGVHAVMLNKKIVSSNDGNILLNNGDKLSIGKFSFEIEIPKRFSSRNINPNNNDIKNLIHNIELKIHKWIQNELSQISEDWWPSLINEKVVNSCIARMQDELEHPYNYTVLSDLDKILSDNWDVFNLSVSTCFPSKKKFKKAFSKFLTTRNKIMHPTRLEITEEDKRFITNYNILIDEIIKPNQVGD